MHIGDKIPAIVTGGASGLGEACVRALRARGAPVAILDLQKERGEAVAAEIGARFIETDVTSDDSVATALAEAAAAHGTARIVINCAGIAQAMREGAPLDEDGCRGVIVNTASIAAFEGQIGQAAYASSKGGIAALTLPAARDLARDGIRVCAIAPGLFATPMLEGLPREVQDSLAAQVPFPARLGDPGEFAELACFIVETGYMNGEVIRLDGAIRMGAR